MGALLIPVIGTLPARIGKGGRTDRDDRLITSSVVLFGLGAFLFEVLAIAVGRLAFERSILEVNVILVMAPVACLVGCLLRIRLVFPLNRLASVRSMADVGLFVAACLAVLWLFSKFRGWGIVFWVDLGQLLIIGVLGFFLLKRLYRRATGRS